MNISDLLKLWRVEKGQSQMAKMPSGFYKEALALTKGDNPYEAKKANEVYEDLVHMRQHKMLMACLRELSGGDKPVNLLGQEKKIYDSIFKELKSLRAGGIKTAEGVEETREWEDLTGGEGPGGQETLEEKSDEDNLAGGVNEEEHAAGEGSKETAEGEKKEEKKDPEAQLEKGGVAEEKKAERVEKPEKVKKAGPKKEEKVEEKGESIKSPGEAGVGEREVQATGPARELATVNSATRAAGHKEGPKQGLGVSQAEPATDSPVFKEEQENKGLRRVRFLKPMPAFVVPDMGTIGPFKEDDITELDDRVVEVLLNNDTVELA